MILTADHGNADEMFIQKGDLRIPRTAHTLNPVPFVIVDSTDDCGYRLRDDIDGGLANVAATVFNLLGYRAPANYEPSLLAFPDEPRSRRLIHAGAVVNLGLETVKMPNGDILALEVVRHPGGDRHLHRHAHRLAHAQFVLRLPAVEQVEQRARHAVVGVRPLAAPADLFVGQHLLYREAPYRTPALHYWARETRNAAAELDYVIAVGSRVVPVEVKAGATGSLRSLHQFVRERSSRLALRFNGDPPSLLQDSRKLPDGTTVRYDLLSLPLYLVGQAHRLIEEAAAEGSS